MKHAHSVSNSPPRCRHASYDDAPRTRQIFTFPDCNAGPSTGILHDFPLYECGPYGEKICMFAVLKVRLDSSVCPCECDYAGL